MSVDWDYWNQMPNAAVQVCVLLSVNRDPQVVEEFGIYPALKSGGEDKEPEYDRRMQVAFAHMVFNPKEHGLYVRYATGEKGTYEINVPQFVALAKQLRWEMPEQFTGYSPPTIPLIPEPASLAPRPEPLLGDRERNNLHRIIGALLEYIKGECGNNKHRDFASEAKLIQHLETNYVGFEGISKAKMEQVFTKAKQLLKE